MSKFKYNINNLDCANCAREIEEMLNKNENFKNASVNFNTCKISNESDVNYSLEELNTIIKSVEPEAFVTNIYDVDDNQHKEFRMDILIIALIIGFCGYFLKIP